MPMSGAVFGASIGLGIQLFSNGVSICFMSAVGQAILLLVTQQQLHPTYQDWPVR